MSIKDTYSQNNVHIQQTNYTCGPVALLNVLYLKGNRLRSEKELEELCNARAGIGTSTEDLVQAAKQIGLIIIEEKQNSSLQDIERSIDEGCYVIVNYFQAFAEVGHYAVITEYDDDAFYLVDSLLGMLRLEKEPFEKFWHNKDHSKLKWYIAVK